MEASDFHFLLYAGARLQRRKEQDGEGSVNELLKGDCVVFKDAGGNCRLRTAMKG